MHSTIYQIAYILVMVGALSWGIIGLLGINIIERLFGASAPITKILYILIGISAILLLIR